MAVDNGNQKPAMVQVEVPERFDVLFGTGRPIQSHPGNVRLRQFIHDHKEAYDSSTYGLKKKLTEEMVDRIRSSGRFLKPDGAGWVEVSFQEARHKVSYTFRAAKNKNNGNDAPSKSPEKTAPSGESSNTMSEEEEVADSCYPKHHKTAKAKHKNKPVALSTRRRLPTHKTQSGSDVQSYSQAKDPSSGPLHSQIPKSKMNENKPAAGSTRRRLPTHKTQSGSDAQSYSQAKDPPSGPLHSQIPKSKMNNTTNLKRMTSDCHQIGFALKQCESCQTWMHHPLCVHDRSGGGKSKKKSDTVLCSNCRQEEQEEQDSESSLITEEEPKPKKPRLAEDAKEVAQEDSSSTVSPSVSPKPEDEDMACVRRRTCSLSNASKAELVEKSSKILEFFSKKGGEDDDHDHDHDHDSIANGDKDTVAKAVVPPPPSTTKKRRHRRRRSLPKSIKSTTSDSPPPSEESSESPPLKKFKDPYQKKKHFDDDENNIYIHDLATPAFFFFLKENRMKIERNLSRNRRTFNRLPKGLERNEIVAREGALWWIKLRPSEIRQFENMSMRNFEQRMIERKEEKNIRNMSIENDIDDDVVDPSDMTPDDEMLTSGKSPTPPRLVKK